MKECTGTDYDKCNCNSEKMGCKGCYYNKEKEKKDEQKIGECAKDKRDKTN